MTYYYIHVGKGRGGGEGRFSLLSHWSELATPNQSAEKECEDVCKVESAVCERVLFLLKKMLKCLYCVCQSPLMSESASVLRCLFVFLSLSLLTSSIFFTDDDVRSISS